MADWENQTFAGTRQVLEDAYNTMYKQASITSPT